MTREETFNKIKELCLAQVQLDKGMPILEPLDPELEKSIKGGDNGANS